MTHSLPVSLKKVFTVLLACAILLATASFGGSTAGAISSDDNFKVYLKLDGIPGESVAQGYEQWINVTGVQFGVESEGTTLAGTGMAVGKPSFSALSFSKSFDAASMPIFLANAQGKAIKSATFVFVRGSGGIEKPVKVLTINLSNVFVTNYSFNNTDESVSLKYQVISVGYSTQKPDGSLNAMIKSAWDVSKGTTATPVIP
ncbi:type VI secretion system secreted protein Hcp [Paenibacillus taihuensis]|uniref:Type VI secretion system secreted protein Hcp n=1 Tax=Paenibacillus taihuensis TaxID=1156355 RepID=A0A3D9RV56_9BACL|nr:type VI secretion system tube protein Hcp [Paenibacillus taihuensis]REE83873.1 type VI secretion system secreted protein Hcp [Paenibacillus taihuensis]